ncbi:bifunctional protein tyrosine phosphatase family protein/NAD(P)/FAD-dependent oxidoreductase [Hydromonas duriensis]|uniref:Sulfide:quinone oxidoreductase n=1 Tax=Hydromonas duriensis TaxID=1527608 RepID=A0A4R6YAK6_9BURK|nr:bifunctional protein tyrosine phosphatase family protein/NAD(P)/FAD-dependent oxidoreductase [Hydromonas duriensis]TDR32562.1 sulfide:quinone oxidoreductase [Hydromonas duriensis]
MTIAITAHTPLFGTTAQTCPEDMLQIAQAGYKTVINNRPDFEGGADQPTSEDIAQAATAAGLNFIALPFSPSQVTPSLVEEFAKAVGDAPKPILAFCRTGTRSTNIFQAAVAMGLLNPNDLSFVSDSNHSVTDDTAEKKTPELGQGKQNLHRHHDVLIIGGGSGGIALAASLLKRQPDLDVAIVEPAEHHFYQPAWTLVGAGEYDVKKTKRQMHAVIPAKAKWIKAAVTRFQPEQNTVICATGEVLTYQQLVVAPGLALLWDSIPGLVETLGKNGVTSNYRADLAPYTWECVQNLQSGVALFTQPMVPIKCAGAPQKALYLSADHWQKNNRLNRMHIEFHNAGGALFSVADFIPNLTKQMQAYNAQVNLGSNLVAVDGAAKKAWFERKNADGQIERIEKSFDMLHVVPPQKPHAFVKDSPLSNADGWVEVDNATLQHPRFSNVFGLGDAMSAPNSKTTAAIRKQVVVLAENLLALRDNRPLPMAYDGYSACPITVGNGKLILAEFGYNGVLMPTFGNDPTTPHASGWYMKKYLFPRVYWHLMLKGHEILARPKRTK